MIPLLLFICAVGYFLYRWALRRQQQEKEYFRKAYQAKLDDAHQAYLQIMGTDEENIAIYNKKVKEGLDGKKVIERIFYERMLHLIEKAKTYSDCHQLTMLFRRAAFRYQVAADVLEKFEEILNNNVESVLTDVEKANYRKAIKDQEMAERLEHLLFAKHVDPKDFHEEKAA